MLVSAGVGVLGVLLSLACRTLTRRRWRKLGRAGAAIFGALTLPAFTLFIYLIARVAGGQPDAIERPLRAGAIYRRHVLTTPGRAVIHVIEVTSPEQCRMVVTPSVSTSDGPRNMAGFATDAITGLDADVLINANFFTPFHDTFLFDSYPAAGDFIDPIGPVISQGVRYGRSKQGWPSFFQRIDGSIAFGIPDHAVVAVTGRQFLLREGHVAVIKDEPPYPRSVVATDAERTRLWLVVVDGKQPRYSDGLSLVGLAQFLVALGAADAIELDGGGSSVMAVRDNAGPQILSRPCHTKIPGRQRPSGVFLGVKLPG